MSTSTLRIVPRSLIVILMALAALLPQAASGLSKETPYLTLARLASALSGGDGVATLLAFDPGMKGFGALEGAAQALVAQAEVLCSIEVLQEKTMGGDMLLDTDWYLQIKSRAAGGPTERRRERVSVTVRVIAGRWRIVALSSTAMLAPLQIP